MGIKLAGPIVTRHNGCKIQTSQRKLPFSKGDYPWAPIHTLGTRSCRSPLKCRAMNRVRRFSGTLQATPLSSLGADSTAPPTNAIRLHPVRCVRIPRRAVWLAAATHHPALHRIASAGGSREPACTGRARDRGVAGVPSPPHIDPHRSSAGSRPTPSRLYCVVPTRSPSRRHPWPYSLLRRTGGRYTAEDDARRPPGGRAPLRRACESVSARF